MYILQKLISIFVISLTSLLWSVAFACPEGYVPCGQHSCCPDPVAVVACLEGYVPCGQHSCCPTPYIIKCATPFTTKSERVKCHLNTKEVTVTCSVTEFNNIIANFQKIPSLQQLSDAFSRPCHDIPKCAKKFQCTKISNE